jgi:hypothetical protein
VTFEAAAVPHGEGAFEIVTDESDRLMAGDVLR